MAIVFDTWQRDADGRYDAGPCTRSEDRRSLESGQGQTPATRADGPSACPGDSSHERARVGASDNPWDMQQAAKSIRVRNAGEDLLPTARFSSTIFGVGLDHRSVPRRENGRRAARIQTMRGRRGRGETPCCSARPYGGDEEQDNRQPWGWMKHGAMAHVRHFLSSRTGSEEVGQELFVRPRRSGGRRLRILERSPRREEGR